MRLGLLYGVGPDAFAAGASYQDILGQVQLADLIGLDSAIFEEHHGALGCPAPGSLAAAAASRTTSIRVGTLNRQIALEYPMTTADDWSIVDVMSRGRAILGVSPGERESEFAAAGVPWGERDGRFRDSVEIVRTAWTQDSVQYIGERLRFPLSANGEPSSGWRREPLDATGLSVSGKELSYVRPYIDQWRRGAYAPQYLPMTPKPLQIPHPPIWVRSSRREIIEWAAQKGLSLATSTLETDDEIRTRIAWYTEALEAAGRDLREVEVVVAREVFLAEDGDQARETALPSLRRHINAVLDEAPEEHGDLATLASLDDDKLLETCALIGSPAEVLDRLKALQSEVGMTHLVCRMFLPGRSHADVVNSIRLLASQVHTRLLA